MPDVPAATSSPAGAPAAPLASAAPLHPMWPGLAGLGYAQEALKLWMELWGVWAGLAGQLALEAGALAWLEAATRNGGEALELCERTVAERLARGGVTAPLLNDA